MGALLHLMDWQKVQLGLEFTVAATFLLATYGAFAGWWGDKNEDRRYDADQGARPANRD